MFRPLGRLPRARVLVAAIAFGALTPSARAHVLSTTAGAGPDLARAHAPLAPLSHPDVELSPLPWRPPLAPTLVAHGPRDVKRIALTFDACTSSGSSYEGRITEVLARTQTPATIFLGGKWMLREERHVQELASFPFIELGLHGYTHPHLTRASDERIAQELALDEEVLYAVTGRRADLFRPPFGEYDDRVLRIAGSLGFLTVNFDAASGDADPRATRVKLLDWVPRIVKPGSIVVMHINGRGWHTAEALEDLITTLRAKGYELVTVSELLGRRPEAAGMVRWEPPATPEGGPAVAGTAPALPAPVLAMGGVPAGMGDPESAAPPANPCPDDAEPEGPLPAASIVGPECLADDEVSGPPFAAGSDLLLACSTDDDASWSWVSPTSGPAVVAQAPGPGTATPPAAAPMPADVAHAAPDDAVSSIESVLPPDAWAAAVPGLSPAASAGPLLAAPTPAGPPPAEASSR